MRLTLNGYFEYEEEVRCFDLVVEDGIFYGIWVGGSRNLWDDVSCIDEVNEKLDRPNIYWKTLDHYTEKEYSVISEWFENACKVTNK